MKEVTLELGGALRRLSLDLNAEIALQEQFGLDVVTLLRRFHSPELDSTAAGNDVQRRAAIDLERAKVTRLLTWAALQSAEDAISVKAVGSWIKPANIGAVMEALAATVADTYGIKPEFEGQLAPFVPTPTSVVEAMVKAAKVVDDCRVVDLGAGDGRLLFAAAEAAQNVTATGCELHSDRLKALRERISQHRLAGQINVIDSGIEATIESDVVRSADVVFLYLLETSNMLLRDRLRANMKPGARIISHDFSMGDWTAESVETVFAEDRLHKVYRWII